MPATATATEPTSSSEPEAPQSGGKQRLWIYFIPPLLFVIGYLLLANYKTGFRGLDRDPPPIAGTEAVAPIAGDVLSETPAVIAAGMRGAPGTVKTAAARLAEPNHGVYLALRKNGLLVGAGWRDKGNVGDALGELAAELVKRNPDAVGADTAELCLAHSYRQIDRDRRTALSNIHRGIRGVAVETTHGNRRMSPTTMLSFNQDFKRAIDFLVRDAGMNSNDVADDSIRTFECDQLLVFLDRGQAVPMYRGNEVVAIESVNRETTAAFSAGMVNWMLTHLHPDGRMTYKWWPSRGAESQGNNMIRQWMATAALGKVAHDRKDQNIFDLMAKNINYNLKQFYRKDASGHGYILFNRKAKLGAMALAAYSILIHPDRATWSAYEESIYKTIKSLHQKNGRYQTFYVPKNRHDNENFYPGEAQLYLATRYVMEGASDKALLDQIMSAFRFYRGWHRNNRNPAFIPWHTQAYYTLWAATKDGKLSASDNQELVDFVFEMNDWLVDVMQQWDDVKHPDAKGRFFTPKRRYGPPHASATGVYLEGLIDAYLMARELGDDKHRLKYARAMVRGIRSSMQLQFVDEVDMFYISKRDEARGGLRTTVYNNEIRVDNVQHTLMGVLKIVRELSDEEWAYGRGGVAVYRDDGEAILARARALTAELKAARAEIDKLERKLRGEPESDEPPVMTPTQREINAELDSARSVLAGLLGDDDDPSMPLDVAAIGKTYSERDAVLEALQRALLAVLARKMGEVSRPLAAHVETLVSVDGLIKRIASCAGETDEGTIREIVLGIASS